MAEKNLDFDTVVDRRNTNCLKYDFAVQRNMPEDVLPLWVADMDFKTSSYVQEALIERVNHGIFGYSDVEESYFRALYNWEKTHHNWEPHIKWLVKTPGIVFALAMAVKAFSKEGEGVLIQTPVYYPFYEVIRDNGRLVIENELHLGEDNRYHINFDDFEAKITDNKIKLFILCSPHNPVGRVWSEEELTKLGDICLKHGVTVVSDEIHQDFEFNGKHHVFASIKKDFEDICMICTSPSKTFNLAGLSLSNIYIPNPKLRAGFKRELDAAGTSQLNVMGLVGAQAAYSKGEEWYSAMMSYVKGNIDFVKAFVEKNLPDVNMIDLEGTYLVWLDFRKTGLSPNELDDIIINKAKLWLDSGKIFGKQGEGFQRINVACPRSILEEALTRIKETIYL